MTLLSRLLVLVAVALLPAIGIQAYNEYELRHTRQIEVQNQALNLAELTAAEQRQTVQGIHQALIALSELPAIKAKDTKDAMPISPRSSNDIRGSSALSWST